MKPLAFFVAMLLCLVPGAGTAQERLPEPSATQPTPPGWSFTPSFAYAGSYDDNVLLRGRGDQTPTDTLNIVDPGGNLQYLGPRTSIGIGYDGALFVYRNLGTLDDFAQHGSFDARRKITPHLTLFVRDQVARSPTTELVGLVAVPFVLTGSKLNDLSSGVEAALSKRTTMTATYDFQWVAFDPGPTVLFGGHSQGAAVDLRHALTQLTTVFSDYDVQRATLVNGSVFDIQNFWVGAERQLSPEIKVYGAGGVSHLDVSQAGPSRSGPAWKAGVNRTTRLAVLDVSFDRSFVPAYGFGGTEQNSDLVTALLVPFGRRFYANSSAAWRLNAPLTPGYPSLHSLWLDASIGYRLQPWARAEVFYSGLHQNVPLPGGNVDRNWIGFQIITAKPMRIP